MSQIGIFPRQTRSLVDKLNNSHLKAITLNQTIKSNMLQRIIKFRGWMRSEKKMGSFEEISAISFHLVNHGHSGPEHIHFIDVFENISKELDLMQFTGLLDKNGKEIYEGDITESSDFNGHKYRKEVVFWEGCFCHKMKDNKGHIFNPKHEEIIGNIYQNPNLLK